MVSTVLCEKLCLRASRPITTQEETGCRFHPLPTSKTTSLFVLGEEEGFLLLPAYPTWKEDILFFWGGGRDVSLNRWLTGIQHIYEHVASLFYSALFDLDEVECAIKLQAIYCNPIGLSR